MTLEELENMDDGWEEWPSFPENEEKFDWSLSYEEMDKLYNPVKKKRFTPFQYYKPSSVSPKTFQQKPKTESLAKYVNYLGKDCPCVGFIDRGFSLTGMLGVSAYSDAYYHSGEEKYLFKVQHGVLAYPKDKIEKYIKPFFPNEIKETFPTIAQINKAVKRIKKEEKPEDEEYVSYLQNQTSEQMNLAKEHGWRIAKMLTQPETNFHYNDNQ